MARAVYARRASNEPKPKNMVEEDDLEFVFIAESLLTKNYDLISYVLEFYDAPLLSFTHSL